jgi:hypothetical protein
VQQIKFLSERESVDILAGTVIAVILLFVGIAIVQKVSDNDELKKTEAAADLAEHAAQLDRQLLETDSRIVALVIGKTQRHSFARVQRGL